MTDEVTTTQEQADNSNENVTEPVNTDNSENLHESIEPANEETQVEVNQENVGEKPKEEKQQFKTLEDALKGYANLQKKLGEQGQELGELRKRAKELDEKELKMANDYGFDTVEDYNNFQLERQDEKVKANAIADEFLKNINVCDYPDEMRKLLAEYRENPTDELLDTIESEFPTKVVKDIAVLSDRITGQLQQQRFEAQNNALRETSKQYLEPIISKYEEDFKNQAFADLFGEGFKAYGVDLDAEKFIGLLNNYKDSVLKAHGIETSIKNENKSATDSIAGSSFVNADKHNSQSGSLLDLPESEMRRQLRKLI